MIYKDIAILILRHLNITSKKNLAKTCKFWRDIIQKTWHCNYHIYHCKTCISRINNSKKCQNKMILKCQMCNVTFCKHLKNKKCKKHGFYDKNHNICGLCINCNKC